MQVYLRVVQGGFYGSGSVCKDRRYRDFKEDRDKVWCPCGLCMTEIFGSLISQLFDWFSELQTYQHESQFLSLSLG